MIKHTKTIIASMLYVALALFLQLHSAFHLFFIEQKQLFLFGKDACLETVSQVGGGAVYMAQFLNQFFIYPYAGAIITATLLILIAILMQRILEKIAPNHPLYLLYYLPPLALLMMHFSFNYFMQGTLAFLLMELAILGCLKIKSLKVRSVVLGFTVPLLFWIAGPISNLFALSFWLVALFTKQAHAHRYLLLVVESVLISIASVYFAYVGSFSLAFLPDYYYQLKLVPDSILYYAWVLFIAVILVSYWIAKLQPWQGKRLLVSISIQAVFLIILFTKGVSIYDDAKSYPIKKLDYHARMQNWDEIQKLSQGKLSNLLYMNYLNLALAEKGLLAQKAFTYDQRGAFALQVKSNKTTHVFALLSDIYFSMGDIYIAQQQAFEGNQGEEGRGNPHLWKRLIQTNLIIGAYPVAEKYITMLEKSLYYADWATDQRRFLYNDKAVEADPLLGSKRKCLPSINNLSKINSHAEDLRKIAEANPQATQAIEYLGCQYLFTKDLKRFEQLVVDYYGTPVLPQLPQSFQEAWIAVNEKDPSRCKAFGVSPQNMGQFKAYRSYLIKNKSAHNIKNLMVQSYGHTYWYYLMFK